MNGKYVYLISCERRKLEAFLFTFSSSDKNPESIDYKDFLFYFNIQFLEFTNLKNLFTTGSVIFQVDLHDSDNPFLDILRIFL